MNILRVRHILGFSWFYLLVFATAALVISTDASIGSLGSVLSFSKLPLVFFFSLPIALAAAPSLVLFYQRQWGMAIAIAIVASVILWAAMQILQTTSSPLTFREVLSFLPQVVLVLGGWTVLVSLPAALLLGPSADHR
ncbi:MAG: hypothetical protein AAGF01_20920 [Cyanobacteria bacterium P01_G01_bin.38]